VRNVSLVARSSESNATQNANLNELRVRRSINANVLNNFSRRAGKGRVIVLNGAAEDSRLFASVL
jgi:hypothetical protein